MKEVCATADDISLAREVIEDYACDIYDVVDSGFPVHEDWSYKSQQIASQYMAISNALSQIEDSITNGSMRICWMEGDFGG